MTMSIDELKKYHKKKNDLFADIVILFNKEPENFYMFPDELIERLRVFTKDTAKHIQGLQNNTTVSGNEFN